MFNYNHLYYFYVTAKLGGVTMAARELNTSQPSLSAQIKSLEMHMEKKLFRKSGRRIELTEDGNRVYLHCKEIFNAAEELQNFVRDGDGRRIQKITIGISREVHRPFVAHAVGSALRKISAKERPGLTMLSQTEDDLRRSLKFNKIDFLISDAPVYDDDLEVRAEYSLPMVLLMSNQLADEFKIKPKDQITEVLKAVGHLLALPLGSARLRQESDLFLQKKKIKFRLVFETDILSSIIRVVSDGIAVGILPLPYVQNELRQGLIRIVGPTEGLWQHKIYVITNKNTERHRFSIIFCLFLRLRIKTLVVRLSKFSLLQRI